MQKTLDELLKEYERDSEKMDRDALISFIDDLIPKIKELEEENLTLWCQKGGLEKALQTARVFYDKKKKSKETVNEKVSFTVFCNRCHSENVFVSGDTSYKVHLECDNCGAYGVEDENLLINAE